MKYLVYDLAEDVIKVLPAKPVGYLGMTHPSVVSGCVSIWHASPVNPDKVVQAIHVLVIRAKDFPFGEVNSAVNQIVATFKPNEYTIAALGASPKFIKWILKSKGYDTIAIGVSKVNAKEPPTKEFLKYIAIKLAKVKNNKIALMDYAKSGESLVMIKAVLTQLWKKGPVVAIALGVGADFGTSKFKAGVDFVVTNIPQLEKGFEGTKYKDMLGRAKDMRDYTTYPQPVKGGGVMTSQKTKFAEAKSGFARAAELGPLNCTLGVDFLEVAESESRDPDSDGDEKSLGDFFS